MITKVIAREVLDSRGNPTVEVDVFTPVGFGREMVPSGASTGTHEAKELRDGETRYGGKGVKNAVRNVNKLIGPALKGMNVLAQQEIDQRMILLDGTPEKTRLGANAIMGVSLAVARAAAVSQHKHLHNWLREMSATKKCRIPVPFLNVINGGRHAGNNIDFQEFMIVPRAKTFAEALRISSETYHALREIIAKKYGIAATNVGDEGGFTPHCHSEQRSVCELVQEPLDLLSRAAERAGHAKMISFATDAAASQFFSERHKKYVIQGKKVSPEALSDVYTQLSEQYPLISIEDPFAEEDWEHFAQLTHQFRGKTQIVGDDLLCTNPQRIFRAIKQHACTCLLLKINQIGTLTEAIQAGKLAQHAGWNVMVSHRSGETEDHFIADFSVGVDAGQIKAGAPCRGERTAKYNQLLRIEQELGKNARYAGRKSYE